VALVATGRGGEKPVEGVRNPEDGTCRVRQTRDERTPVGVTVEGAGNPRRGCPVPAGTEPTSGRCPWEGAQV
jgi:hypothetical protein